MDTSGNTDEIGNNKILLDEEIIGKQRLVITKEERKKYGFPQNFVVRVKSSWTFCAYAITIYPRTKGDLLLVEFGAPVSGTVVNGEIVNYKLLVF